MGVYVDKANIQYGRMKMCHMIADTLQELHEMADKIGVQRKWFQDKASTPHYDICLSKKELAKASGAIELDKREMVFIMKRLREPLTKCSGCGGWFVTLESGSHICGHR